MQNLSLLFTKDGLQWQISEADQIIEEEARFVTEVTPKDFIEQELEKILKRHSWEKIKVFSAFNHFSLAPEDFSHHELGHAVISYNAETSPEHELLKSTTNTKHGVQFYYCFPKVFYRKIEETRVPFTLDFSGEVFLDAINTQKPREIHINLYHHQMEFLVMEEGKLLLYNNLDATSDVDFLYFIMFSMNKIGFSIENTFFYIYGEIPDNETFISELEKFTPHIQVAYENFKGKHLILNQR